MNFRLKRKNQKLKVSYGDTFTLSVAYSVLATIIILQMQGLPNLFVGLMAVLGLVGIGVVYHRQRRKRRDYLYEQELNRLRHTARLAQHKKLNKQSIMGAVQALAASVDAKDHYTFGHSEKVAKYAEGIAKELGYSAKDIDPLKTAALLHDIGKIGISDYVLSKDAVLNQTDWQELKQHPERGVKIIEKIEALKTSLGGVLHHHESYDGSGYPMGLKGETIPLDARIIAVADSYDAMTSNRPYRKQMTHIKAIEEITRYSGSQFDPIVVNAFKNTHTPKKPDFSKTKAHLSPVKI
jgi:putative nucleotidyltransferase with HDIG domain